MAAARVSSSVPGASQDEHPYWLALYRAPGIGPVSFARLLSRFSSPREVFSAHRADLAALKMPEDLHEYLQAPDWPGVEQDLDWLGRAGAALITLRDVLYPPRLREIHDPPPLLFVIGDADLLSWPQIAMVGTRKPSRDGESTAHEFAKHLAAKGLAVTSGLAFGIDTCCHQGALAAANGKTIAVLGTGPDLIYPAQNKALAQRIAETGALVSEFLPRTPALAGNFPRRNRIISGLSQGVLVVEAAARSGSLITARQAAEQGREVFAIPGSIHNPLVKGCHELIKEGAKLVETAEDILEELKLFPPGLASPPPENASNEELPDLDADYAQLLTQMGIGEPVSIDQLVERCGLTADAVSSMLLILELRGYVAAQHGGCYTRLGRRI
jgi:DNA processing protein